MWINWNAYWYFNNPCQSRNLSSFVYLSIKMISFSLNFQEKNCWNSFVKKTKLRGSILVVLVLKLVKSLLMKVFAAAISSYRINAKIYGYRNGLKLSELTMTKSKSELNLKVPFLELLTSQVCRNHFQAMIFSLNKVTITSRHWYRSFCAYICRIYEKKGLGTVSPLEWTSFWH